MIELAIFDWDGVVADSDALAVEAEQVAARAMAEELGAELEMESIDWTEFQGWGRVKIAAALFGVESTDEIAESYREAVVETTVDIMGEHNLSPVEDALQFLGYMQRRVGNLAVATSSNRRILDPSIELFGLQGHFRHTIAHRECIDDKPLPGPYREVMNRFNVAPEHTVIFEDSRSGITAARHSGGLTVALPTTQTYEFLRASTGAHLVADNCKHAAHLLQPQLR